MKAERRDLLLYLLVALIMTLIVFMGSGCVTQKACERKFPPRIETTTIIKDTTIIKESVSFDTMFNVTHDSVFIYDHETKVKIKYINLPGDSVYISAECPADTIRIPIETTTIIEKQAQRDLVQVFTRWLILIIIAYIVFLIAKRLIKQII